ncbi:GGDEF domain-containing protein [Brucepastera parasyntrophica]|uniref:GGDEF domain-containing protein n=1 Tax=Brucepastera parasyntrophica TaxID=2880008 RepID=UPI002109F404|nr:GGDEF domain-containing protein [Brucepastera parasyntrophica]ULQ58899.1 GGDEF domain-containing protein [Brucepastera parasyntrophica]
MFFSICVAIGFLITIPAYAGNIPVYQYVGVGIYFVCAILLASIYSYNLNVVRRIQYIKENQLEIMSVTDSLTNIYNRQMFDRTFEKWIQAADSNGSSFSIIMFDLDNFKMLNDSLGHLTGDRVLIDCVEIVRSNLREGDIFARWGGEEFMVLLPRSDLRQASDVAERLRAAIEVYFNAKNIQITASFGATQFRQGDTTDSIIMRVDDNLYSAKEAGKNTVCAG